ncbi:MAG: phosphatase PAP2 family protein [Gemmatimonadaceae bacterium]
MEDLSRPPSGEPPVAAGDRRTTRRGHFGRFWNLFFALLRKTGIQAKSFYTTVGIFLVAGVVVGIIGVYGFAKIAEIVKKGYTQPYDVAILQWIHARQTPGLTTFLLEMTYLGTGSVVIVVVGVAALFLWHTEHKHSARLLLAATIGDIVLNNALKLIFHRERPTLFDWGTTAASSSFPSGHAMSATVVYGTVAYLVARLQQSQWARVLTLVGAFLLILTICFTRLYLGVHYPSDVIGGIVIGLAWAGFCMATLEASLVIARRRAPASVVEERPAPKEKEATAAAAAAVTTTT